MPLQATSGAASYDAFGGGVAAVPNYIEDVFSTYLYTGNAPSSQSITNGIDLAGKGGLVWLKNRSVGTGIGNELYNTNVGAGNFLSSNNTNANTNTTAGGTTYGLSSFNSNGFTVNDNWSGENTNGQNIVSWTFRKQPKFFDVVTYTGDGTNSNRRISHNLGSAPGCIIVKRTDSTSDWVVYHRSLPATTTNRFLMLNATDAYDTSADIWGTVAPTSTDFGVGNSSAKQNMSGGTYIAYLFAHNAGGFGLTGTDNVISCGSYTGTGAVGNKITLGYEPQWLLIKRTDTANSWYLFDTMRGLSLTQSLALLPNGTNTDLDYGSSFQLNADGVTQNNVNSAFNANGGTYIYIAIRRGPMKVPTSGTSVFSPIAANNAQGTQNTTGFPVDLQLQAWRSGVNSKIAVDRLRGVSTTATNSEQYLVTDTTAAEVAGTNLTQYWNNTGFQTASGWASFSNVYWNFRRAPNTHDEVCYTGTGVARTINHNLGAVPELMIMKNRSTTGAWYTYVASLGVNEALQLNQNFAQLGFGYWNSTAPTSSVFSIGAGSNNDNGVTYVAYLFATCAGVSKCGTFTGNGSTQAIACGFTGGSRFVLIKATSTTGNWICVDTARGMTTSSNPVLYLNSTAAETATSGACITSTGGFTVDESKLTGVNTSGVSYIFLSYA